MSERVMWQWLRKKQTGFLFRHQYPIGPYVLDFYCPSAKVCVEVDGEQHQGRQEQDLVRDEFLRGFGIETLRVPTADIFSEEPWAMQRWVEKIGAICEARRHA